MNRIKCVNCRSILNSPVFLPCHHSICKHHTNETNQIKCEKCGKDHTIPKEGLPENEALAEIIASKVHDINLGEAHNKAKLDWDNFESLIKRVDLILSDPSFETFEEISDMKHEVMLKREELKLKIDQEADKLINKLDGYVRKYNAQLNGKEFQKKSSDLAVINKSAGTKLNEIKNRFNKVVLDETWWKNTSSEIGNELKKLSANLENYKRSLANESSIEEIKRHAQLFQNVPLLDIQLSLMDNTHYFILSLKNSKIINTNDLMCELSRVCEFQNKPKWELLYRGSENGFSNEAFHVKCVNKGPTLVIVKSNDGFIFGGYTKAKWCSPDVYCWIDDFEAYLFRLKTNNLESKKYKIVQYNYALYCSWVRHGFGTGDLCFDNDGTLSTRLTTNIPPFNNASRYGLPFKPEKFQINTQITEVEVFEEF